MFDRYNGLIDLNKYFEYEYGKKNVNSSNIISLDECSYETNGANARFWINDKDGYKYLFKQDLNYSDNVIYAELLACKIAEILNLPCAKARACVFDGKLGLLSKNFLKKGEIIISGSQIIQESLEDYPFLSKNDSFFSDKDAMGLYGISQYVQNISKIEEKTKYVHNTLNNIEVIWLIIERYLFIKNKFDIEKTKYEKISIIDSLIKLFLFDILTMQGDRHVDNWGIIKTSDLKYKPSFVYDNGAAYALAFKNLDKRIEEYKRQYKIYETAISENSKKIEKIKSQFINYFYKDRVLLTVSEDDIINIRAKKRKVNTEILNSFIKKSDSIYIDYFIDMINKVHNIGIEQIIKMVEKENGINFPNDIKNYVISLYEFNYKFLLEILQKNGVEVAKHVK